MATTTDRLHTKVTADTTQARRSMRNYGVAGKKAGASITSGFAKFGLAMAGVQAGIALVSSAFRNADFANEVQRLREVVTDTFGKELAAATGGTVSQLEALRFGAKAMSGAFELTRDEMKLIIQVSDDLGKRSLKGTTFHANELFEAINTGRVNSLAKYGVSVDRDVRGNTAKAVEVLKELRRISADPIDNDEARSSFDKFKAQVANANDTVKEFFGNIVTSATGVLAGLIDEFNKFDRAIEKETARKARSETLDKARKEARLVAEAEFFSARRAATKRGADTGELFDLTVKQLELEDKLFQKNLEAISGSLEANALKARKEAERIEAARAAAAAADAKKRKRSVSATTTEDTSPFLGAEGSVGTLLAESETFERRIEHLRALEEARRAAVENQEELDNRSRASSMRVAEELKRIEEEKRAAFQASVEGLSSSAQSMIEIGETLFGKSKALEVLNAIIMVAKESALAASAFATGNIPGGIAHVAAGVSWGAVAAKAGGGGGGGGSSASSSRGAAGGGFARSNGGSSGGGGSSIIVNVGSDFIGKPDELATAITTRIRSAERRGSIQPRENDVVLHT